MYTDLQVETYILKTPVYDLADIEKDPYAYFIHLNHDQMEVTALLSEQFHNPLNRNVDIEGAIYISYKGREVSPLTYWDEVDSLWAYYLNMIEEYLENGNAESYFPDQPIPIIMKKATNSNILFSVNNVEILVNERFFLSTLINKAEEFFNLLSSFNQNDNYENELSQIRAILSKLG
ncbi:hypothetical protein [Bacillus sp. V59.32b]|uniref:hypothetical protein n=1 Tax=Bacillus sp. V59.32b TaxID=1758642 RepID=UPI000E3C304E|nr:hypothetical protein [Bacillus sp. V59.32b]RFU63249.1 hypothetical protein D0463_11935 [Bacillus sp. V59.32b]